MIESMTGFGRGVSQTGGATVTVEMRSVNSRFCEVSLRIPRIIADHEPDIQALVKQALSRGRINVQVTIEQAAVQDLPVQVNADAARGYAALLDQLRTAAGISDPIRLEHLLTFSDIFAVPDENNSAREDAWNATLTALELATEGIRQMRQQEGRALQADLLARIDGIERGLRAVEHRAPERVREAHEKLRNRVAEFLSDERINPDRLEMEIALLADRLDVTEECVRLDSHLQVFREGLLGSEPVGRKLNFLVQEINREVNTIGSKANDAEIAHLAVQMKEELERIREQVQNIE